jgi:NADH-quinone oxidoreductase subunit N
MAVYVVMTLGAFLCVLWMRDEQGRPVEEIASLAGLAQTRPAYAWALSAFMWSLAGIPPFFGFWPKLVVFKAAVASGYVALAVAGILGTVIGAYYYMKIIKVMFIDEPTTQFGRVRQPIQGFLILVAAVAISPLGYLLIEPLNSLTIKAAGSLF